METSDQESRIRVSQTETPVYPERIDFTKLTNLHISKPIQELKDLESDLAAAQERIGELKVERDRLRQELEQAQHDYDKLKGYYDEACTKFDEAVVERNDLREKLAAAQAREQELRGALEALRNPDGCFCAGGFAGPGHTWSHSRACTDAIALLEQEPGHDALDAALEQARREVAKDSKERTRAYWREKLEAAETREQNLLDAMTEAESLLREVWRSSDPSKREALALLRKAIANNDTT
jgi:DNA repair exonuclease SbcCD ATPase subunit